MKKMKYLNRFTLLFFVVMVLFTLFAKSLNRQTYAKVIVTKMREKQFEVPTTLEDGTEFMQLRTEYAVPAYVLHGMEAFVLVETEEGSYVKKVTVQLGATANQWYEVIDGIEKKDKIVMASDRELEDGMKVIRVEAKD